MEMKETTTPGRTRSRPDLLEELCNRAASRVYTSDLEEALYDILRALELRAAGRLREAKLCGRGDLDEIVEILHGEGLTEIARSDSEQERMIVLRGAAIVASVGRETGEGDVSVRISAASDARLDDLRERIAKQLTKRPPRGEVALLASSPSGNLVTRRLGRLEAPLERGNYVPSVIEAYDHVLADLRSDAPCGRFVLLEGPPGTGKSWLVRALATESDALFVFVSPGLMGRMSAPEVVPTLLREREREVPIVLILEDADLAIVRRAADNLSLVSELCNLTDGLLAELIDIRIVATTNARRVEVDDAILRPGRLCADVAIGALPEEQAAAVYRRLTGRDPEARLGGARTLAEIYRLARRHGWTPPPRAPARFVGRVGFDLDDALEL